MRTSQLVLDSARLLLAGALIACCTSCHEQVPARTETPQVVEDRGIEKLIEQLESQQAQERAAAGRALVEIGPPTIPLPQEAVERENPSVRRYASAALWRIDPATAKNAVSAPAKGSEHGDATVRESAAPAPLEIGPPASAPGTPPGRLTVAVLTFEDKTGDPELRHWRYGIQALLMAQLSQVKSLRMLPARAMKYGLRQLKLKAGEQMESIQARKIGELIEARRVVCGSYRREGDKWHVSVQILNVASGETSAELSATSGDWFDVRDELTEQILKELGIVPSNDERKKMSRRYTTFPTALQWFIKAYALETEGRPVEEVQENVRRAIAADPQFAQARLFLAGTLGTQGKFTQAEKAVRQALKIRPDYAGAHRTLGVLMVHQERYGEAELQLWKAHSLDPDDSEALALLGQLYSVQGKPDMAIGFFEMAKRLDPADASIHACLALAYARKGLREKAVVELREAERLAPEGIKAASAEQMISQAYEVMGDIPLALDHYDRFVAQARQVGGNPELVASFEKRARHLKASLTPDFITGSIPKAYTEQMLQDTLGERLTKDELEMVVNPLSSTPKMRQWAKELAEGADSDLGKAKAIFGGLMRRIPRGGGRGKRTAQEVFTAWNDPEEAFSCQEYAKLYIALAREVGLKAFYVHVEEDYRGKVVHHDCAAVFADGKSLLVDPAYRWFGAPHREFVILDDVQAIAHHLSQPSGAWNHVLRCRVGVKLHPDFAWGQLALVAALMDAGQWMEARRELEVALKLEPTRWDVYLLQGILALHDRNLNAAVSLLRKGLKLNPESADAHFLLALILEEQGDLEEARDEFRAGLRYEAQGDRADGARRSIAQINEKMGEGEQELGL